MIEEGRLPTGALLSDENNLEHCTLELMISLLHVQLKAFILAHDSENQLVSKIPKKGTLDQARAGELNSILVAYNCRMKNNLLEGKQPHSSDEIARCGDPEGNDDLDFVLVKIGGDEPQILPSKLIRTPIWRTTASRLFNLRIRGESSMIEDPSSKADTLLRIMNQRFRSFLKNRVTVKSKRVHWSMEFAYNNLPVSAAVIALSGHLPMALECLTDSDCLLINDMGCYIKCEDCPDREGAYLYFDLVRRAFVRSGKVVGRGFRKRNNEHLSEAKKPTPSSRFYRWWPSAHSDRAQNRGIKGHFEHLVQLVAVGFDPNCEEAT